MHITGLWLTLPLLAGLAAALPTDADAQAPPLYEEEVAASDPARTEQARELERYLAALRENGAARDRLFRPDFRSPEAYAASTRRLRQALGSALGYPPPGRPGGAAPQLTKVGEDAQGVYHRVRIAVLPGVHAIGLYIVPKSRAQARNGRMPLVVSMHGGGGSPELATFHGGANYHDMVRGAVECGYIVFAPQHLFVANGFPPDVRQRMDARARLVGTTVTAIEIAKITRSLDVLLKRPEVDPKRVGMVGLSYGGYYTLLTAALEPRIKAAVSSCWFNDDTERFDGSEPYGWSDVRFMGSLSLFGPAEVAALVCPRALQVQVGTRDDLFPVSAAGRMAPKAAAWWKKLGLDDRFQYAEFEGGHEFRGDLAWTFLAKHL